MTQNGTMIKPFMSDVLSREISGGPVSDAEGGDPLPPGVGGVTSDELDPYDGHGQGNGGSGNRAPERWGDLW